MAKPTFFWQEDAIRGARETSAGAFASSGSSIKTPAHQGVGARLRPAGWRGQAEHGQEQQAASSS